MRRRRKRLSGVNTQTASSSQLLGLSLFIMLLAFFIVLNAISSFEEKKMSPVMESVEAAFSNHVERKDTKPSVTPSPVESINEGETVERLDALFQAQISSFEAKKNSRTGTMYVELPLETFSKSIMTIGQEDLTKTRRISGNKKFFLPTLISILKSDQQGVPYRMDVVLHTKENPAKLQNQKPKFLLKTMKREGGFARQLEKAGLSQKLISMGIRQGDPEVVELVFRRHVPFSPVELEKE